MGDPRRQLTELAGRVENAVADGSLSSERAVQLRAAEPLVEILGWDVRGDEVQPEVTLGDQTVDYLLTIGAEPAIGVWTVSPDGDVKRTVEGGHRRLLENDRVPRGIATDGRRVVLLIKTDSTVHDHAFPFADLEDHADALGRFHRSSLESEIDDDRSQRREAARRLATERGSVAAAITEDILEVTGTDVADTVSSEVDRLIDDVVEAIAPDGAEFTADAQTESSERSDRSESASETEPSESTSGAERSVDGSGKSEPEPTNSQQSVVDASRSDESYVARFFGGSSSVGAVGTGSPRSTTVGVVRYLLENQELHRAVTFPWEVESGEPVVADSRPTPEWIALENPDLGDVYVRPIDDPEAAKAVIEALADAVGLRVMFQGDW